MFGPLGINVDGGLRLLWPCGRFSPYRPADATQPRLPAGGPGAGQPGRAALRPRHLHGKVPRVAVQPDGVQLHHDDR